MTFITHHCHIRNLTLRHQGKSLFAKTHVTLDDFLEMAYEFLSLNYPKFYKMDRLSKLGFLASEIIVKDMPLFPRYSREEVALVLSNASASLDTDQRYSQSIKTVPSPGLFVYTLPNIVAGEICIRQGIQGENAFFVSEAFDARQIADYVTLVMTSGKTKACIAGWIEVLDDHHDVFLYLVENEKDPEGLVHTAEQLEKIYSLNHE